MGDIQHLKRKEVSSVTCRRAGGPLEVVPDEENFLFKEGDIKEIFVYLLPSCSDCGHNLVLRFRKTCDQVKLVEVGNFGGEPQKEVTATKVPVWGEATRKGLYPHCGLLYDVEFILAKSLDQSRVELLLSLSRF